MDVIESYLGKIHFFGAFCQGKFPKPHAFSAVKSSHSKKAITIVSPYFMALSS